MAAALGDHRRERLGHHERLEQLVRGHRREALELRACRALLELALELLDAARRALDLALELPAEAGRAQDRVACGRPCPAGCRPRHVSFRLLHARASLSPCLIRRDPFGDWGAGLLHVCVHVLAATLYMYRLNRQMVNPEWTNGHLAWSRPGTRPGSLSPRMTGVGIDLLEIDRLERALARRPRLAERLFTDAERAFAAERGEPARHLAARFCAKEAVAKALALRDGDWHDVEVLGGGDGPPVGPALGPRRGARRRARRRGRDLADPLQGHGRRRGGAASEPAALAGAAARRRADARDRPLGDRDEGDPVARADGARGGGARARGRRARARRAGSRSSAARATTAATGSSPRGCCARPGATSTCCCVWAAEWLQRGRAARSSAGCPAPRPRRTTPRGSSGAHGHRRRAARHRLDRRAAGPGRRRDRATQRRARAGWSPPTSRAASTPRTGEVAGAAVRAVATATFHRAKPGLWIAPGQGARRARSTVIDIGIPRGAPGEADVGLIARRRAARHAAPRRRRRRSSPPATSSSSAARAG